MQYSLTILIGGLISLLFCPVQAQELEEAQRVVIITHGDCLLLEQHIPDDDVNYKPDVDVRGNSVVPAETSNGNSLGIGEGGFSFFMTHDALKDNEIAEQFGLSDAQEGKMILGRVSIQDGEVFWNGAPMKTRERSQVYALCRDSGGGKNRPILKR